MRYEDIKNQIMQQRQAHPALDIFPPDEELDDYAKGIKNRYYREDNELSRTMPSNNPAVNQMASTGRKGDTMMAHVTPGDYVIPKNLLVQHPEFLVKLKKVMSNENEDYRSHMVGSGFESINPETGSPEFGFGSKFKSAASTFVGRPTAMIANTLGEATRGVPVFNKAMQYGAQGLGTAANMIPGGKQTIGSEGYFGGLQTGFSGKPGPYDQPKSPSEGMGGEAAYSPTEMKLPGSLQEMGGLTDTQRRSYLASQGAYGEGLGGASRDYYFNLLQRNIKAGQGNLLPAETQYLGQQGVNTNLTGQDLINALRGL